MNHIGQNRYFKKDMIIMNDNQRHVCSGIDGKNKGLQVIEPAHLYSINYYFIRTWKNLDGDQAASSVSALMTNFPAFSTSLLNCCDPSISLSSFTARLSLTISNEAALNCRIEAQSE